MAKFWLVAKTLYRLIFYSDLTFIAIFLLYRLFFLPAFHLPIKYSVLVIFGIRSLFFMCVPRVIITINSKQLNGLFTFHKGS